MLGSALKQSYGQVLTPPEERAKEAIQAKIVALLQKEYNPDNTKEVLLDCVSSDPEFCCLVIERGWRDYFTDMQARWTNFALVSALVITMISLDPVETKDQQPLLEGEDILSDHRHIIDKSTRSSWCIRFQWGL